MAGTQTPARATGETAVSSAVVWISEYEAVVAALRDDGRVSTCEIGRGALPEPTFLAQVIRVIGDRTRVVILGPSSARLALEREYVALFQRPDQLVDVEPAGPVSIEELVDRVRTLAA